MSENEKLYEQRGWNPVISRKRVSGNNSALENFLQSQIIPDIQDVKSVETVDVRPPEDEDKQVLTLESAWNIFDPEWKSWSSEYKDFKAKTYPGTYKILSQSKSYFPLPELTNGD